MIRALHRFISVVILKNGWLYVELLKLIELNQSLHSMSILDATVSLLLVLTCADLR